MPTLMKLPAAAMTLGITPQTLRRYLQLGRLCGVRLGSRIFIEETELRRFAEAGRCRLATDSAVDVGGAE